MTVQTFQGEESRDTGTHMPTNRLCAIIPLYNVQNVVFHYKVEFYFVINYSLGLTKISNVVTVWNTKLYLVSDNLDIKLFAKSIKDDFIFLADQYSLDLSDTGLQILCCHLQFRARCLYCLLYSCDVSVDLSAGPDNAQSLDLKVKCLKHSLCCRIWFTLER